MIETLLIKICWSAIGALILYVLWRVYSDNKGVR